MFFSYTQVSINGLGQKLAREIENFCSNKDPENENLNLEDIQNACAQTFDKIFHVSQSQLNHVVEALQTMENEKRNHMRSHYDQKLNMCRVSYRLEQNYRSNKSKVETLDNGGKMHLYYQGKIHQSRAELEQCQTMRQVQDKTLHESQQSLKKTQDNLHETIDTFSDYKGVMEEKCSRLEDELNRKRKQEVWAHFEIAHLKKKAKIADRVLCSKKKECKTKQTETKELQSRLKRSLEIREGLERAFERRASIRGRLDILQENNQLQKKRPCTGNGLPKIRRVCVDKGTQARLSRGAEMKDQGLDSPPFFTDQLDQLKRIKDETEQLLRDTNEKRDHAVRQNEAYRRLVSGKSIAMILATKHRELCSNPKSMDAEILYDLTMPQGILTEEIQKNEPIEKKSTPTIADTTRRQLQSNPLVQKKAELKLFGGICGTQIDSINPEGCSQKNEYIDEKPEPIIVASINRQSTLSISKIAELGSFGGTLSIPKIEQLGSFGGTYVSGNQIDTSSLAISTTITSIS